MINQIQKGTSSSSSEFSISVVFPNAEPEGFAAGGFIDRLEGISGGADILFNYDYRLNSLFIYRSGCLS